MTNLQTIHSVERMQNWSSVQASRSQPVGFVPTMGALHDGHLDLVRRSLTENKRTVVSIFVNPTQFGPNEDFETYPRMFDSDKEKLENLGVDIIFAPTVQQMYPTGEDRYSWVDTIELGNYWCGASRPGFFRGVTTVVTKLFHAVAPTSAYFGEKDFQQLTIIKRMVKELLFGLEIVAVPTTRQQDGLAMSSRNAYLGAIARKEAAGIYQALIETRELFRGGERQAKALVAHLTKRLENISDSKLDYAGIADIQTLKPIESGEIQDGRMLCAVHLDGTRLIDNMALVENHGA